MEVISLFSFCKMDGQILVYSILISISVAAHPWFRGEQWQVPLDILVYKSVKAYLRITPFKRAALKVLSHSRFKFIIWIELIFFLLAFHILFVSFFFTTYVRIMIHHMWKYEILYFLATNMHILSSTSITLCLMMIFSFSITTSQMHMLMEYSKIYICSKMFFLSESGHQRLASWKVIFGKEYTVKIELAMDSFFHLLSEVVNMSALFSQFMLIFFLVFLCKM